MYRASFCWLLLSLLSLLLLLLVVVVAAVLRVGFVAAVTTEIQHVWSYVF